MDDGSKVNEMRVHIDHSAVGNFKDISVDALKKYLTEQFLTLCRAEEHVVCLSTVFLLEFSRKQAENVETKRTELHQAIRTLNRHGIDMNANGVQVSPISILEVFSSWGIRCERLEPTKEIYDEAARRCALHEAPVHKSSNRDEMRDLVVWLQVIEDARFNGGAVLISKDKVHTCDEARLEGESNGPVAVYESFEEACAQLGRSYEPYLNELRSSWESIREKTIGHLPEKLEIKSRIDFHEFRQDGVGYVATVLEILGAPHVIVVEYTKSPDIEVVAVIDQDEFLFYENPVAAHAQLDRTYVEGRRELSDMLGIEVTDEDDGE